jgi:hypothetical protein
MEILLVEGNPCERSMLAEQIHLFRIAISASVSENAG